MRRRALFLSLVLLLALPAVTEAGFPWFGKKKPKAPTSDETPVEAPAETGDEIAPPALRQKKPSELPVEVLSPEGEALEGTGVEQEGVAPAGPEAGYPEEEGYEGVEAEGLPEGVERAEEPLDINIEEILLGASTDEALLALARKYSALGDTSKAAAAYQRIIEDFPGSRVKYEAFYELGALRYLEGKIKDSRLLLQYVISSWKAPYSIKEKARDLLSEIDSIYHRARYSENTVSIGVLLPVEGRYARFGEAALKGVLLAAETFSGGSVPVEIFVRDVGPDPESARSAVDELVSEKKVRALIGPVFSSSAYQAAYSAQLRRVPVVVLSQREGVTSLGEYVFRNSLMPGDQASLVAREAVEALGKSTFAVLHPENPYGAELANRFAEEVSRLGGEVLSVVSYKPGSLDFTTELTYIFGIEEMERTEGRRTIREFSPTVKVDALYIPDYYRTVSLIVPFLEYLNVTGVHLLGSNGWNSDQLVRLAGKGVQGAVFADGFFAGSSRPGTREFMEKFRRVYGEDPGVIESQAYDAATALISALASSDFRWTDRETVKDALLNADGFRGSTGTFRFLASGEAEKELYLLAVEGRRIKEIRLGDYVETPMPPPKEDQDAEEGSKPTVKK